MAGFQNTIVFSQGEKLQQSSADDIAEMQGVSTDVSRINHTGNPEGVVAANPSSLCHDPVSGNVYFKQTGTSNTGWVLINAPSAVTPIFNVFTSSSANLGGDAYVQVAFDQVTLNTGAAYDTTTSTFTAPKTGTYNFKFNCRVSGVDLTNTILIPVIKQNGTRFLLGTVNPFAIGVTGGQYGFNVSCDCYCQASDTVICEVYANGTAGITVNSGVSETFFQGEFVG